MLKSKYRLGDPDSDDSIDDGSQVTPASGSSIVGGSKMKIKQLEKKPQKPQKEVARKQLRTATKTSRRRLEETPPPAPPRKETSPKKKAVKSDDGLMSEMLGMEAYGEVEGEGHADAVLPMAEVLPDRPLHRSEISIRLSWLGKTAHGDAYCYLKAKCTGLGITSIHALLKFKHLQFVDLSENLLTLDALQPVTELPYLLLIHADINKIKSAALKKCRYLQVIIMNNNSLLTVEDVFQPELSTLEVGYNNIKEINFINRMPQLRVLDFRHNFIADISNINFPNLDSLYLAGNKIKDLTGICNLPNLRLLHVRGNPIRFLNGFETPLPKLKYLNLRNTKIGTLRQIRILQVQPALEALVLTGTFYMGGEGKEDAEAAGAAEDDPELRIEVLATLPRLKRLNKTLYTPEERQEAKDLQQQWLEEGEKEEDEEVDEEERGEEEEKEAVSG